ncbi:MAG: hypothetical protein ACXVB1_13380, partial [Pseudobdellovibrionaceae bacterium]
SHMDSVVNISTQLDDVYKVQVLRRGQLCTLEFNVKRVGIPGSPSDTYTVEASLIRISGNLPICT